MEKSKVSIGISFDKVINFEGDEGEQSLLLDIIQQ